MLFRSMRAELVSQPGFAERFLTEARIMATIRHPGVVAVHDYHSDADRAFLVMEYIDGESLSRRLHRDGPLTPELTLRLLAQAAEALQAAHTKGVVHRDIKPGNLLVTADDTLLLTDFGIARSAATSSLTMTGAVLGTPSYLSPEQVAGEPATYQSDIYALGVVAYECLTGRRPFDGDTPFEVAMKRLREPPPPLSAEVPRPVAAVVERALATDLQQRWQSAAELAMAARQVLAGAALTEPSTTDKTAAVELASTEAAGATAPTPASSATAVSGPAYLPGRAATPPPPTLVDRSQLLPAGPTPTAGYGHMSPTGHGVTGPPPTPTPAPPPPVPPAPERPLVVLIANLLLALSAAAMLVYSAGSLATVSQIGQLAEEQYPKVHQEWGGTFFVTSLASIGLLAMLALVLLALAGFSLQGRRAARTWTYLVAIPLLCCCGPCWWSTSFEPSVETEPAYELDQLLATAVPDWYPLLAGRSLAIAVAGLLVAMVLLMLPPANRFFAPRPIIYYYPYYPPYQPHR